MRAIVALLIALTASVAVVVIIASHRYRADRRAADALRARERADSLQSLGLRAVHEREGRRHLPAGLRGLARRPDHLVAARRATRRRSREGAGRATAPRGRGLGCPAIALST